MNPADSVSQTQADACHCYDQSECTRAMVWLLYNDFSTHNIGYANQDGIFGDVDGQLQSIEVGEFGTFGVMSGRMWYKLGTLNNPYAVGPINHAFQE